MSPENDRAPLGIQEPDGSGSRRSPWSSLVALANDHEFRNIIFFLILCTLSQALYIRAYGSSLPWADEWGLTAAAVGQEPLSWKWLLRPANEHRAPLTRFVVLVLGRLGSWDWQLIHSADLLFMALGSLALVVTARSLRGRTAMSDVFLCLLVLSPWHYATVALYGYAYAFATGLLCLAIALAATLRPLRSVADLAFYLLVVLGVACAAGPAGNLWALGLCAVLLFGMFDERSRLWKITALLGTGIVSATSMAMLLSTPSIPDLQVFRSHSLLETIQAGARISMGWLGEPPLKVIWPFALVLVLVPGLFVLKRLIQDVAEMWRSGLRETRSSRDWWGLGAVLVSALLVGLALGYGRARYPEQWPSRYGALTQPIGILLYLIMVRVRAPRALLQTLALTMAVCVGWCWPRAIAEFERLGPLRAELVKTLRRGTLPLSVITSNETKLHSVGLGAGYEGFYLECLLQLRDADLSIFRHRSGRFNHRPIPRPQAWEAEAGKLSVGLTRVVDWAAVSRNAVEVTAGSEGGGVATYEVDVPVAGPYQLCCRLQCSMPGQSFSVKLDEGPLPECALAEGPVYRPYVIGPPITIGAGKHRVTVVLPRPGMKLDLLELVPLARKHGS